jgi:hypothetical protein
MKYNLKFLLLLSFLLTSGLVSKAQFNLTGEYRPLSELRHGYKTLAIEDAEPAFLISQRARLNAEFTNTRYKFGLSLQDVRIWGNTTQNNLSDDFFSVHQAWGEVLINEAWSVKVGRQELTYDDGRLFGNANWLQQARSHDLALLKYSAKNLQGHLGLAFNQDKDQLTGTIYTLNNYKAMQFLWLHKDFKNFGISLITINNGIQYEDPDTLKLDYKVVYSQTFGARGTMKYGDFNFAAAAYSQIGNDNSNKDLSAFYLNLEAGHTLKSNLKTALGVEIMSGTDQDKMTSEDKNYSFSTLYTSGHKFNGHLDYFYAGNHQNSVGLNNVYAKISKKTGKLTVGVDLHAFLSNAKIVSSNEEYNSYLGTEFDSWVEYQIDESLMLSGGYSMMFATDSMKIVKKVTAETGTQYWGWVMLTFKPVFIKG